jgi:SAM-dependent methyltransferase
MCTDSCIVWLGQAITSEEVFNKTVLEVGAYDVNGSVRPTIERLSPADCVGIDMRPGPGVDKVCRAEDLVEVFGQNCFDMVISANTLEHVRNWKQVISAMKQVCKPGGLIIIIVPADWYFHAYPNDFWRFQPDDVSKIFSDYQILKFKKDSTYPALSYAKVRKPLDFVEEDLSSLAIYSMVAHRRIVEIRFWHFLSLRYLWQVLDYKARQAIPGWARFKLFIVMGLRIRVVKPIKNLLRIK